ncbi:MULTISPECIES: type II toxin-antitoxin system RelE family toxin [unclassified Methanoculleus]|uniref:type II toxin-antitoxin system RelE family toxin n=1 Tax=unclassified Methanoculleus TaxID=2619537 RepID=UPI0025EF992A|nr:MULTISPECIES: type II toxin-antitoxin system RelE/ParE family toxin [unclassified Methanoculleus]
MFTVLIERKARELLKRLPPKTRRIVVEKIQELAEDPFPGGNKEKLECPHPPAVYRLHISRSFTVFYIIEHQESIVKIEKIVTIERAHKEYSRR